MAIEKENISGWTISSLKEHYDTILKKNDELGAKEEKRIDEQFKAQRELSNAINIASKEAITKAEESQKSYNTGHNDLSRKMEAQYKDMLPRVESDSKFKSLEDKIESKFKELNDKIIPLQLGSAGGRGKMEGIKDFRDWIPWIITIGMALFFIYNQGKN
jgi:hypothetical protein